MNATITTSGFHAGDTVLMNGERFKISSYTNTTLTIYKANTLERLTDWLYMIWKRFTWWIEEKYYDIEERITDVIRSIRT